MSRRWAVLGAAWGGLAADRSRAQLWDTGPWDQVDARASDQPAPASRPATRAADDVVLPFGSGRAYRVSSVAGRALATHHLGAFIEVYADNGGVPAGAPAYSFPAGTVQVLQTGVFGEYDLLNIHAPTAGLALPPGRWWISTVCRVSGEPPPQDGYGFFATAGNHTVQGSQAHYRVGAGPWTPVSQAFGFPSDLSFTVLGFQPPCYANCDGSTAAPMLNVNDFNCFLTRFVAGDSWANCDGSTSPPTLNILDLLCFQNRFAAGCT